MFRAKRLEATSAQLLEDDTRPYFLWWTDCTVRELQAHLAHHEPEQRAHWLGSAAA